MRLGRDVRKRRSHERDMKDGHKGDLGLRLSYNPVEFYWGGRFKGVSGLLTILKRGSPQK